MKNRKIILFIYAFLPSLLWGSVLREHQHTKYKYEYRVHLKNFPSTYSLNKKDTNLHGKCLVNFFVSDKYGTNSFIHIKLNGNKTDTILESDIDGFVSSIILPDSFNIKIEGILVTPLEIDKLALKPNTTYDFISIMGQYKSMNIALIRSQRKLSAAELDILIDNLSNDKDDNILFVKKICYYSWEI